VAALAFMPESKSCGAAMLVPAMPPEAGIRVLFSSMPKDCALAVRAAIVQAKIAAVDKIALSVDFICRTSSFPYKLAVSLPLSVSSPRGKFDPFAKTAPP